MPRQLDQNQCDEALRTAIEKRLPVQGSVRMGPRWALLKSRFLPRLCGHDLLCIEPPLPSGPGDTSAQAIDLVDGTEIGVTFRRGHHKCMFVSQVAGRQRIAINSATRVDAVLIRRPSRIDQLQRRAYERTIVPEEFALAVRITPVDGGAADRTCAVATDISAGGMGLCFPEGQPSWTPTLGAAARLEIRALQLPPILVDGLYKQCWTRPDGSVSWGYQFVGLESTDAGRATLESLNRLVRMLPRSDGD